MFKEAYFYPRPLRGGRRKTYWVCQCDCGFLSTPSARRATTGADIDALELDEFLSTPSARRATWDDYEGDQLQVFLSTPSARRATGCLPAGRFRQWISIHALCEEGDCTCRPLHGRRKDFYPRPLRGGRRTASLSRPLPRVFLSTPSARRATLFDVLLHRRAEISIHALCEEGDRFSTAARPKRKNFYPRPLRGGRRATAKRRRSDTKFLSTPSARRAT